MSRVVLYRGMPPQCDHGTPMADIDCTACKSIERRLAYRPTVSLDHWGRLVLGTCAACGIDVLVSEHLTKTVDGRYLCDECKDGVEDCAI